MTEKGAIIVIASLNFKTMKADRVRVRFLC